MLFCSQKLSQKQDSMLGSNALPIARGLQPRTNQKTVYYGNERPNSLRNPAGWCYFNEPAHVSIQQKKLVA